MGIVEQQLNVEDWCESDIGANIDSNILAFAQYRPALIATSKPTKDMTNSCNPRTLEMLNTLTNLDLPEVIRMEAYAGAIGAAASEYFVFENMANSLIHPNAILANPKAEQLPDISKPDVCYATASGLAHYVEKDTMAALCTYLTRFDERGLLEYAVLCMRMLQQKDEEWTMNPSWIQWASTHKNDIV